MRSKAAWGKRKWNDRNVKRCDMMGDKESIKTMHSSGEWKIGKDCTCVCMLLPSGQKQDKRHGTSETYSYWFFWSSTLPLTQSLFHRSPAFISLELGLVRENTMCLFCSEFPPPTVVLSRVVYTKAYPPTTTTNPTQHLRPCLVPFSTDLNL